MKSIKTVEFRSHFIPAADDPSVATMAPQVPSFPWKCAFLLAGVMLVANVNGETREISPVCRKDYNTGLFEIDVKVYPNDDTGIQFLYAFDDEDCKEPTQRLQECQGTLEGDFFHLNIIQTIPMANGQPIPDGQTQQVSSSAGSVHCGVRYADSKYKLTLASRITSDYSVWTRGEKCHKIECKLDDAIAMNLESLPSSDTSLAISGDLPVVELSSQNYRLEMFVKRPADHITMYNADIGDEAYLEIRMYPGFYPSGPDTLGYSYHFVLTQSLAGKSDTLYTGGWKIHLLVSTRSSLASSSIATRGVPVKIESNILKANPTVITLQSTNYKDFILTSDDLTSTTVTSAYFKVTAEEEISVVAIQRRSGSTGSFTAIPDDALGTRYYCAFFSNMWDRLMLVATQDNTEVRIKLPLGENVMVELDNNDYKEYDTIVINLQKENDIKLLRRLDEDITGCIITSNKPISVTVGHRRIAVQNGMDDHITMQLPPAVALGRKQAVLNGGKNRYIFITYKSTGGRKNWFKLVSGENGVNEVRMYDAPGSTVLLNNFVSEALLFHEFQVGPDEAHEITATGPVMIAQFTASARVPGDFYDATLHYVPVIEQWSNRYDFVLTETYTTNHVLMIAVRRAGTTKLRLDGGSIVTAWDDVFDAQNSGPGTSEFQWTRYVLPNSVSTGYHKLEATDFAITFYAVLYSESNDIETFSDNFLLPGIRYSPLAQTMADCNDPGADGNIIDDDCDGRIDEEERNGLDDDGDGRVDEDIRWILAGAGYPKAFQPFDCWSSAYVDFSTPKRKIVNDDGCRNSVYDGKAFFLEGGGFKRLTNYGEEPVIARTGNFRMSRFEVSDTIYFGCQLDFCLDWGDETCDDKMCDSGVYGNSRRKREAINDTYQAVAAVKIINFEQIAGQYQTSEPAFPVDSCIAISTFVIVAVVLGILVVLVIVAIVYLIKKLRN
ncbi:hypothetical protein ScPMuIL_007007 [Solemya velum]